MEVAMSYDTSEKYFMFMTDYGHMGYQKNKFSPINVHYSAWKELLGNKANTPDSIYSLEEIIKIGNHLSDTLKKRILSLKEGNYVKLYRQSAQNNIWLLRVSQEYLEYRNTVDSLEVEIDSLQKQINSYIPMELTEKLNNLKKTMEKSKKTMKKLVNYTS